MSASVVAAKHDLDADSSSASPAKRIAVDEPTAEQIGADRKAEEFLNYKDGALQDRVSRFYRENHRDQTFAVVKELMDQFATAPVVEMTVMEAMTMLNDMIDESDPDLDAPQIVHAYQSAEAARRVFPDDKWLHICAFLHDLGKAVADPRFGGLPQTFVVGDTFPLGCRFSDKVVFPEYFELNPDTRNPAYQTDCGSYRPHCGLSNVLMSFGHDEYLYRVLMDSNTKLPEEAMYIVRFHSFYAHHQHNAYAHLRDAMDDRLFEVLRKFQPCDLYSKSLNMPDIERLRPYYAGLLKEFGLDGPLRFRVLRMPSLPSQQQQACSSSCSVSA